MISLQVTLYNFSITLPWNVLHLNGFLWWFTMTSDAELFRPFNQTKKRLSSVTISSVFNTTILALDRSDILLVYKNMYFHGVKSTAQPPIGYCLQCFLNSPPGENVNSFTTWWMIYLTREYLIIHLMVKVLTFSPNGES